MTVVIFLTWVAFFKLKIRDCILLKMSAVEIIFTLSLEYYLKSILTATTLRFL